MASLYWPHPTSLLSFSSFSSVPECVSCRKMERLGCDSAVEDDELINVFRFGHRQRTDHRRMDADS